MDWILLALFVWSAMGAAVTGALFPPDQWYRDLNKPAWTPPDWVFPITWTVLYACMALAATRIAPLQGSAYAMAFWAVQISFNGLWSPVFFGLKRIRSAMFVVASLWLSVLGGVLTMWPLDPIASLLFVPYLIWVTIASALNASVWMRNPDEAAAASLGRQ